MFRTPKVVGDRRDTTCGHPKYPQQLVLIKIRLDGQDRMEAGVGALKAHSVLQVRLGDRGYQSVARIPRALAHAPHMPFVLPRLQEMRKHDLVDRTHRRSIES